MREKHDPNSTYLAVRTGQSLAPISHGLRIAN